MTQWSMLRIKTNIATCITACCNSGATHSEAARAWRNSPVLRRHKCAYWSQCAGWRSVCSLAWWVVVLVRRKYWRRKKGVQGTRRGGGLPRSGWELGSLVSGVAEDWSKWSHANREETQSGIHISAQNTTQLHNESIKEKWKANLRRGKWFVLRWHTAEDP